jgi:hypothetical protein
LKSPWIALFALLLSTSVFGADLLWPLKSKPGLAASFCEYRPRHFHGGVDIKTWGARSLPCLAAEDGRVTRIKVQATGYGKALYLTIPSGETLVYGHLDHFAQPVADRVRAVQEATGNFEVDLFWEGDSAIPFKKGDVVAYSGVTGTVFPHLHFEVRDASQGPLNPLTHGLYASDHIAPTPVAVAITPLDGNSTVEGDFQPRLYTRLLRNPQGVFEIGDPVGASGRIGISVDEYDQADGATNEMAAYKIELEVAGETYWTTAFEGFDFSQTRSIEVERDYRLMRRGRGVYHRLYRVPGNRLKMLSGDGVIDAGLADPYPVDITITLSDAAGNTSQVVLTLVSDAIDDTSRSVGGTPLISGNGWTRRERGEVGVDWFDGYIRLASSPGTTCFRISGAAQDTLQARSVGGGVAASWIIPKVLPGEVEFKALSNSGKVIASRELHLLHVGTERPISIVSDDSVLVLDVLPESLYDDAWLEIEKDDGYEVPRQIESVYRVDPRDQPLKSAVKVKIRQEVATRAEAGWGVYYYNPKLGWIFLGADRDGDYLVGNALAWGDFGLLRDITPPTVSIGLPRVQQTTDKTPEFAAVIKDALSDITASGVVLKIDGRRVPVEYDQPRARAYYRPWKPLAPGKHTYEFNVTDRVGNTTHRSVNITIQG